MKKGRRSQQAGGNRQVATGRRQQAGGNRQVATGRRRAFLNFAQNHSGFFVKAAHKMPMIINPTANKAELSSGSKDPPPLRTVL